MRTFKIFMASMAAIAAWSIVAAGLALCGWWINSTAERGNADEFFDWAVNEINTKNNGITALILIVDGEVVSQFFTGDADEETLFPTASFSNWITALSIVPLVEQKLVDLDAPVSPISESMAAARF